MNPGKIEEIRFYSNELQEEMELLIYYHPATPLCTNIMSCSSQMGKIIFNTDGLDGLLMS